MTLVRPVLPGVVLGAEDNFTNQPSPRRTGLAATRPQVLEPIRRSDPAEDVWIVPRDPGSVSDGSEGVLLPPTCQLDAGVTLALLIGTPAWRVSVERALDVIAGYAVALDVVRRSVPPPQGYLARSYRTHTPLGSFSAVAPEEDAMLTFHVNGEERQRASIEEMVVSPNQLIASITARVPLSPGDVVLTGTPGGVAFDVGSGWLVAGDQLVAAISGLSDLSVSVVSEENSR